MFAEHGLAGARIDRTGCPPAAPVGSIAAAASIGSVAGSSTAVVEALGGTFNAELIEMQDV
ncbi:hypothetical protein H0H10_01420 [Streptomyces sp. TRM S81-3]|uniref:Uncharacterized protein n=1 Tax=Streptomyces griseicoloratus TaxID=2752516 RepID=A0A926KZY3_9ACTN|nr:hypothetical protein [Streptomyces griseicoloratus]MBD0417852.1 hypothetical protein [Streptomyces griseicoloratus]